MQNPLRGAWVEYVSKGTSAYNEPPSKLVPVILGEPTRLADPIGMPTCENDLAYCTVEPRCQPGLGCSPIHFWCARPCSVESSANGLPPHSSTSPTLVRRSSPRVNLNGDVTTKTMCWRFETHRRKATRSSSLSTASSGRVTLTMSTSKSV